MNESHFKTHYDEHSVRLLGEIFNWFDKKILPDVVIHVDNQAIAAHKLILGASSTFFKSIFCTRDRRDFYFEDINYRTMKAIIEYMYTGELIIEWELMPECLKLADCFMIRGLSTLYSDKVVTEPAAVSQEMLETILAIGQTRLYSQTSEIESAEKIESTENLEDTWQKQTNLPKLQLKRDAKTGNWIPKADEIRTENNAKLRPKAYTKRKSNESSSKDTKLRKTSFKTQDSKINDFKESLNQKDNSTFFQCSNEVGSTASTFLNTQGKLELDLRTRNNLSIELQTTTNADCSIFEQDTEMSSQEINLSVLTKTTENAGKALINANKTTKNKKTSKKQSPPIPHNSNRTSKKEASELNGKVAALNKPAKTSVLKSSKTKSSEGASKTTESISGAVRKSKQKQKTQTSKSSTASKATDMLIKKLFLEPNSQSKANTQQTSVTTNPNTNSKSTFNNNSTPTNSAKTCEIKLESEDDKVLTTEQNETKCDSKSLNRLTSRCKASDWHIDESEVLECDEEYEQHKNAPCPQPAEFLKTQKLVYGCPSCNKAYTLKSNYRRHYVVTHRRQDLPVYKCPICDSRFTRTDNRNSHIRKIHDFADPLAVQAWTQPFFMCLFCKKGFYNDNDLQNHLKASHPPT